MTEILSLPSSLRLVLFIAQMLTAATLLFCAVYGIVGKHRGLRVAHVCTLFASLVVVIVTHTPLLENMNAKVATYFHLILIAPFATATWILIKEKDFSFVLDMVWAIVTLPFLTVIPYFEYVSSACLVLVIIRAILIVKYTLDTVSKYPGRLAIKYALDRTADGIAFVNIFGRITYLNTELKWVLADLQISSYMRATKIADEIKRSAIKNGRKVSDLSYIVGIENKAYRFSFDSPLTQITCVDVTEEEQLVVESEQNNFLLEKTNKELNRALGEIDSIEKERELLKIKGQLHDELAQKLSVLHMFILNDKSGDLKNLKNLLSSLEITPTNDEYVGTVTDLVNSFKAIGVQIHTTGELPESENVKKIAYKLTKEATANAIKHAKASEISIEFETENNVFKARATNGGIMPKEIVFGNGLTTLKAEVEAQGGRFVAHIEGGFVVKIEVPTNQNPV
ncbi:MAG: hypothetical protein IJ226_02300 [Clostridia bacterium]|nr:hypothetical protein [Clostridia bacterium]